MTLELPAAVEVELVPEQGADVAGLLVAIDVHHAGRYYYGTLVGLSDDAGRVRLERGALERDFAADQRLFLMDYRVPLEQCDVEAAVRVDGGQDFTERRASAVSPLTVPAVALLWRVAANERIAPAHAVIRLDRPDWDGVVRVRLPIRPIDAGPALRSAI